MFGLGAQGIKPNPNFFLLMLGVLLAPRSLVPLGSIPDADGVGPRILVILSSEDKL